MMVTPEDVLAFWLGETPGNPQRLKAKTKLWFIKSFETDQEIAERFLPVMAALASGLSDEWAARGPQGRLAAIIALDQFNRNVFRNHHYAFAQDPLARALMRDGLERGEDKGLSEPERIFFYLPAEHSEDIVDQDLSVKLFTQLTEEARPDYHDFCRNTLDYAHEHKDVIEQFGRFPHRNGILQRPSTPEEKDYLSRPGAGF
jgi:uncharacterized protein (DUF924 family)